MKLVKDTELNYKEKKQISDQKAEEAIKTIIEWIGEDPEREGLKSTPKRVIKAFKEYFQGYNEDPAEYLTKTFTEVEGYDDMVIEKNISMQKSLRTSYGSNYRSSSCCLYSIKESCGFK